MSAGEIATFRLERSFAASPEDVFDAWTNPKVLERWWSVQSSQGAPRCEVDLRVGGRYVLRMRDDTGELHIVGGEYREVDRPRRLVYTWRWEGDGGPHPGHVSIVTVEFRADGGMTTVVLGALRAGLRGVAHAPRRRMASRARAPRAADIRGTRRRMSSPTRERAKARP